MPMVEFWYNIDTSVFLFSLSLENTASELFSSLEVEINGLANICQPFDIHTDFFHKPMLEKHIVELQKENKS